MHELFWLIFSVAQSNYTGSSTDIRKMILLYSIFGSPKLIIQIQYPCKCFGEAHTHTNTHKLNLTVGINVAIQRYSTLKLICWNVSLHFNFRVSVVATLNVWFESDTKKRVRIIPSWKVSTKLATKSVTAMTLTAVTPETCWPLHLPLIRSAHIHSI